MKISSKKNIRQNKSSKKNKSSRKNKSSKKNKNSKKIKCSRKNRMIGGNPDFISEDIFSKISRLTTLNISSNKIDDKKTLALTDALKDNTILTTLIMNNNEIGDNGAIALATLLTNKKTVLIMLDISFNKIANNGAKALAVALKDNNTLITLNISNNNISNGNDYNVLNVFEEALLSNMTLRIFDISGNKLLPSYVIRLNLIITNKVIQHIPKLNGEVEINETNETKETIEFIKDNIRINIKSSNNKSKHNILDKYIKYLTLSDNNNKFNSLINNNNKYGGEAIKTIEQSEKYIVYLHGTVINTIFKLPDNINIIFISPLRYSTCINTNYTKEIYNIIATNINEYISNPYCNNYNNKTIPQIFNESILYLGGQYCVDLQLSNDSIVNGIYRIDNNTKAVSEYKVYFENNIDTTLINLLKTDFLDTEKKIYISNIIL